MKTNGYLLLYNDSRMKVKLTRDIVYYPYDSRMKTNELSTIWIDSCMKVKLNKGMFSDICDPTHRG